jgi:hypothetical protein
MDHLHHIRIGLAKANLEVLNTHKDAIAAVFDPDVVRWHEGGARRDLADLWRFLK